MLQMEFSQAEIQELQTQKRYHQHPRVRQRMEAVHLKALNYGHKEIGVIVGISQTTLRSYPQMYQAGGIKGLEQLDFYRPESELEPYWDNLEAEFKANPVQNINQAAERIEELTGIHRSPDQVRRYRITNMTNIFENW